LCKKRNYPDSTKRIQLYVTSSFLDAKIFLSELRIAENKFLNSLIFPGFPYENGKLFNIKYINFNTFKEL